MRPAQLVYILFYSVMYSTMLRAAEDWQPFTTHFFALDDKAERRAGGRRRALAVFTLNFCPFAYFAGTVYLLGEVPQGTGWRSLLVYFSVPWMALAVPGFLMVYRGLAVWGREFFYGTTWRKFQRRVVPHEAPRAYLLPGLFYLVLGAGVLCGLLLQ